MGITNSCAVHRRNSNLFFQQRYPGIPESAHRVRRDICARIAAGSVRDLIVQIVSELVNNAIMHTRSGLERAGRPNTFEVRIRTHPIRIAVIDDGPLPASANRQAADEHDRGLGIISALGASYRRCGVPGGQVAVAKLPPQHTIKVTR